MSSPDVPNPDPKPEPPVAPDFDQCCGNGCEPCIFDLHDMAMDQYRQALRAWNARREADTARVPREG
ncbi:oxidoreductase-like domain-containing protein [Piscinibacter gummiphilus]|uniref:Oxidoreductase-like domain-containing protein n=1 Tax=Piscinibacter gummiphilus TaxID=946333 RepID=A0ABZ0CV40_9BURK|nr:oxidoreductase-like domain-containing protein [Piscinibacter gummiphilus]WOB06807.1 oxidoreductase-like domain-containing protein [Piscinibacter gummiphilus]